MLIMVILGKISYKKIFNNNLRNVLNHNIKLYVSKLYQIVNNY